MPSLGQQHPHAAVPNFSYALFRWTVAIAMTRQNELPLHGPAQRAALALVPVFDMCNHEPDGRVRARPAQPRLGAAADARADHRAL